MTKKGDGSHVKESTDSSNTTLEDDDVKGFSFMLYIRMCMWHSQSKGPTLSILS